MLSENMNYHDSYFSEYDLFCAILVLSLAIAIVDGTLFAIKVLIG